MQRNNNFIIIFALFCIITLSHSFLVRDIGKQQLHPQENVWGVSEQRYSDIKESVKNATTDTFKKAILKVVTSDFAFKASQIIELLDFLSSSIVKEETLLLFKNRCIDPSNAKEYQNIISTWDKCEVLDEFSDEAILPSDVASPQAITQLVDLIQKSENGKDRVAVIQSAFSTSETQVTTKQLKVLFSAINDKVQALSNLCVDIQYLNNHDIDLFINSWNIANDILLFLNTTKVLIADPLNRYTFITSFTFPQILEQLVEVLNSVKPTNSVFGTVSRLQGVKNIAFVIDFSSSMATTFETPSGKSTFRFNSTISQLSRTLKTMTEDHSFTIIGFEEVLTHWRRVFVKATDENIDEAIKFLQRQIPIRRRDVSYALYDAYDLEGVDYVYFLTDGIPNDGETDIDRIIEKLESWYKDVQAPMYSIAFLKGQGKDDKKLETKEMTLQFANVTNGVYVYYDD